MGRRAAWVALTPGQGCRLGYIQVAPVLLLQPSARGLHPILKSARDNLPWAMTSFHARGMATPARAYRRGRPICVRASHTPEPTYLPTRANYLPG